jgi:aminocarboxymuconate-semialdehyde decarboxylase
MRGRRDFLKGLAGAAGGILFVGCGMAKAAEAPLQSASSPRRREVMVNGRRVTTVDIHCHGQVPEVWELVKDYDLGQQLRGQLDGPLGAGLNLHNVQDRLRWMDEQGFDVQAVSINPFWYAAERDLAEAIIRLQNEKIAELCASQPDRFVGLASIALQYPYLAAEQLEDGVRRLGMRGCLIGGSVNGQELADPRFHPFWAKAEELGCVVFIHPQGFPLGDPRFQGNGMLTNVIGNPLETTVALSHLIFEGTLDRFPGVKVCAAHGGGYLPSYIGRSDVCGNRSAELCRPVSKPPSEYLKQLYFDSMVFTDEGLRHLVAEAGASQIVLGTDYPYGWTHEAVDHILRSPTLSDADKEAILGGNAMELLRMRPISPHRDG